MRPQREQMQFGKKVWGHMSHASAVVRGEDTYVNGGKQDGVQRVGRQ